MLSQDFREKMTEFESSGGHCIWLLLEVLPSNQTQPNTSCGSKSQSSSISETLANDPRTLTLLVILPWQKRAKTMKLSTKNGTSNQLQCKAPKSAQRHSLPCRQFPTMSILCTRKLSPACTILQKNTPIHSAPRGLRYCRPHCSLLLRQFVMVKDDLLSLWF